MKLKEFLLGISKLAGPNLDENELGLTIKSDGLELIKSSLLECDEFKCVTKLSFSDKPIITYEGKELMHQSVCLNDDHQFKGGHRYLFDKLISTI